MLICALARLAGDLEGDPPVTCVGRVGMCILSELLSGNAYCRAKRVPPPFLIAAPSVQVICTQWDYGEIFAPPSETIPAAISLDPALRLFSVLRRTRGQATAKLFAKSVICKQYSSSE